MNYVGSDIGRVWDRLAVLSLFRAEGVSLCDVHGASPAQLCFLCTLCQLIARTERFILSSYIPALCWTLEL